jgi:hypothetical protein
MDHGLFELLLKNRDRLVAGDRAALERVVFQCVMAKALVVAKDEREASPILGGAADVGKLPQPISQALTRTGPRTLRDARVLQSDVCHRRRCTDREESQLAVGNYGGSEQPRESKASGLAARMGARPQ